MKKKQRWLYSYEAEFLGLKPKENEKGRNQARYKIEPYEWDLVISNRKPKKQKRNHRYRLNDYTAKKIGLEPNKTQRYDLKNKPEVLKKLHNIKMEKDIKRLFFDIETSPMIAYTWRTGYKINLHTDNIIEDWKIICISYKWQHENTVKTLTWDSNHCDKQLLKDFIKIANQADEIIAHNGDRFDIKKIRTRCIFHRIPMFPKYRSLDTLKKAKSGFVFNSNRLDYIAKFLGVGAKLEHEGFNMWVKCMQGDKQALKDMVKYCEMDIIVLEDVYFALQNYIKPNTHAGVINGNMKYSCPTCGNDEDITHLKNDVTEKGTVSRVMECNSCGHNYNISNSSFKHYLESKTNYN